MCLAKWHNVVQTVRLKHATPQSRVKHTTIEPLRSRRADGGQKLYATSKCSMSHYLDF